VGLDEELSLEMKVVYTRRTAHPHLDAAALVESWKSTQTNNTRSSHASCKVHWGWRWDFRTFIV